MNTFVLVFKLSLLIIFLLVDSEHYMKAKSPDASEDIQRLVDESNCKYPDMNVPYNIVVGGGSLKDIVFHCYVES